jgi:DNA-binding CsgD family transcriptional regulator
MPAGQASSLDKQIEEAVQLVARLSRLENEILGGLVNGHSMGSIATILSLAPIQAGLPTP